MYIPLKVKTDYTLLQSLIKIPDLINFCICNKINFCGICDTNLFGSIEFYKRCKSSNIKPIIGLEIKVDNNTLCLYAKNYEGYKNLLKINTIICERDLTFNELKYFLNDVILVVPFASIFMVDKLGTSDVYVSYKDKKELNDALIKTNNVIYMNDIIALKEMDLKYLKYLDVLAERDEKKYQDNYFLDVTLDGFEKNQIQKFINSINIEIPFNNRYIPKYKEGVDSFKFLYNLCLKGLEKRLGKDIPNDYLNRLKYELKVIDKMGFVDYFLIVYDYVLYAKKNNILVGPGRGSAAGSLVSFSVGITDIDPIKYDLLFERFLNYERVSMPDIDIDFDNTKREDVINYVKSKYGSLNVSGGMTYTTFKTRLVLRDVGKLKHVDERLLNKFIKVLNKDCDLKKNLDDKVVKEYLNNYKELKEVYDISLHLEGLKKNISTHAAGIVIGSKNLDEIIPMYRQGEVYLCGCGMEHLEDLGLLKMDFLALKNLSTISNIIKKISNFKLQDIDLNDKETYELFQNADTDGIFQFETPLFKKMLPNLDIQNFSELVASIALVRPGPKNELERYIKRKKGLEEITYYDERLKSILEETYGVIIYQEQVISILVKMAGFSYAEADNIRRAMSKKKEDIILEKKELFINNSIKNGYKKEVATNIFEHIITFASYGFNKSHSVSYAIISYWMAYLKTHYNILFVSEIINDSIGNIELIKNYLAKLKQNGMKIMKVDINISDEDFIIKDDKIYLPFKLIKNIKSDVVNEIIRVRSENGKYTDIFDFFRRTNNFFNKEEYKMLINAGVLNSFKYNTKTIINNLDSLINYGNISKELGEYALTPEINTVDEYEKNILEVNEINSYGFYITNHPVSKYVNKNIVKIKDIKKYEFKSIHMILLVEGIHKIKTKKNEDMAFIDVSDETGKSSLTIFPKYYYLLQNIEKNDIIKVCGNVTKRFDKNSIIVTNIIKE